MLKEKLIPLLIAASFFPQAALAGTPSPEGPCDVKFEDQGSGTHGWIGRSDYALGTGVVDCNNLTYTPPTSTVFASIAWSSGDANKGTSDHDTNACTETKRCATRRIEANTIGSDEGQNCFLYKVTGTSMDTDGTPFPESLSNSPEQICTQG